MDKNDELNIYQETERQIPTEDLKMGRNSPGILLRIFLDEH